MRRSDREREYKVCVFAASAEDVNTELFALAGALGEQLVKRGYAVVYGGTTQGCMGRLAAAVAENHGTLIGVVPQALDNLTFSSLTHSYKPDDLYGRQREFERISDIFIALPGGVGTIAELFSLINTKLLGAHNKPIIILNPDGSFDPMLELLQHMIRGRFATSTVTGAFSVATSISSALRFIDRAVKSSRSSHEGQCNEVKSQQVVHPTKRQDKRLS